MSRSYELPRVSSHDSDRLGRHEKEEGFLARNGLKLLLVTTIVVLLIVGIWGSTKASDDDTDAPVSLVDHVDLTDLLTILKGLNVTAQSYAGSRSVMNGYNASAAYIETQLAAYAPGWIVSRQVFSMRITEEYQDPFMELIGFEPKSYVLGVDYDSMDYSGSGLAFANMSIPNDLDLQGCNPEDWTDFVKGSVAIVQRGECAFYDKGWNAQQAGAIAIVIYNSNQRPLFYGSMAPPNDSAPLISIPALSASYLVGDELVMLAKDTQQVSMLTVNTYVNVFNTTTFNVITESPTGRADSTIVIGSHLDSVPQGPGINDNGSGSAANLHLAKLFASLGYSPTNKVRFAWWGAEEEGLVGSEYYVNSLNSSALKDILVNLNFDMIASPNMERAVYNGSSDPVNPGSGVIQRLFENYFASQSLPTVTTAFDGRSDYGPFLDVGIAAGGLFTGAEELKSLDARATFGGVYNVPYDVCYHESCDTYENIDPTSFLQNVQAAASTLQILADQPNLQAFLQNPLSLSTSTQPSIQSTPTTTTTAATAAATPTSPRRSPYSPLNFDNGRVYPSHNINKKQETETRTREFYKNKNGVRIHPLRWPVV